MASKYFTFTLDELQSIVGDTALSMMASIKTELAEDNAAHNIWAMCYNDGIRTMAKALTQRMEEEAKKQE